MLLCFLSSYVLSEVCNNMSCNTLHILGIRKRMAALAAKKVSFHIIGKWIPAVISHLHHVVRNTLPGERRIKWWESAANHMCDIHTHNSEVFPKCLHGPDKEMVNKNGDVVEVAYIEPGKCTA